MDFAGYTKSVIVSLSGFILLFIGVLLPIIQEFQLIPIFILFLLTATVSFLNKKPLGGLFYGLFTSMSLLIGNLLTVLFIEYSLIFTENSIGEQGLSIFISIIETYIPEFISFIIAFTTLGLFFGLMGYVFDKTSLETIWSPPLHYRDYWSSIHSLGKSRKREYYKLDRRFGADSFKIKGLMEKITSAVVVPQPDLAFVLNKNKKGIQNFEKGSLYDISSGRLLDNNLTNPNRLVSKYRPYVLKIPEYATGTKGVRRIVFEKILENFLGRILKLRIILPFFIVLSMIFVFFIQINQVQTSIFSLSSELTLIIAIFFSVVTLLFVWRWGVRSKKLFNQRPDERILILIIYVVLGLLFGFYAEMILNIPTDTAGWVSGWFIWTRWFLVLSVILGLGYIFVHREVEVINTYFYDNSESEPRISSSVYRDLSDEPFWIRKSEVKNFWVIRFMYFWKYELAKIPHSDWERIELWFDAQKGVLKWVVSDYHYRELWYEVKNEVSALYVGFFLNFHTPIPILDDKQVDAIKQALNKDNGELIRSFITGKSVEIVENIKNLLTKEFWQELHPSMWVSNYGLQNIAAGFCSKLPWRFWRYAFGLEEPERYLDKPAAVSNDEPVAQ